MDTSHRFFTVSSRGTAKASLLLIWLLAGAAMAHEQMGPHVDIRQFVRQAEFIFMGKVLEVGYRSSEAIPTRDPLTGAQAMEEGQPVFEDGSNLPHSFVAFQIEEVYKGKRPVPVPGGPPSDILTLRFVGGPYPQDPEEVFMVHTYPLFDVGDRDVLFVEQNTVKPCPLVKSAYGRFRIVDPPAGEPGEPLIFTNWGYEVLHILPDEPQQGQDEVGLGPFHALDPVMTHQIGELVLQVIPVEEDNESGAADPIVRLGEPFTESRFGAFVNRIVNEVHTPEELANLPPITTADINQPFSVIPFHEDGPEDFGPEPPTAPARPWLDELPEEQLRAILAAEREELRLAELAGDNPVLPETACDLHILQHGPLAGDISGPDERPDCYVNIFDLAAMAALWLECNDPDDPDCLI